jgi:hypothetical protein
MKLLIDKNDVCFKDLKIPKGYRLLEDWELLKELRTNPELKKLLIDGYVFCKGFDDKIRGGFLNDFNLNSDFLAYSRIVDGSGRRLRGVFVKVKQ